MGIDLGDQPAGVPSLTDEELLKARKLAENFPGTKLTQKVPGGSLSIDLNPKLTQDQAAAEASLRAFEPLVDEITTLFNAPETNPFQGMNDVERTAVAMAIDSGSPILVSKAPESVQNLQAMLNSLIRSAFGEGGKNLTGTEKKIITRLISVAGKSDDRIRRDLNEALSILREKRGITKSGARGEPSKKQTQNASKSEDEIDRIFQGTK
jgi:hypothetical protein